MFLRICQFLCCLYEQSSQLTAHFYVLCYIMRMVLLESDGDFCIKKLRLKTCNPFSIVKSTSPLQLHSLLRPPWPYFRE